VVQKKALTLSQGAPFLNVPIQQVVRKPAEDHLEPAPRPQSPQNSSSAALTKEKSTAQEGARRKMRRMLM
jgi:hypothetical protein